MHTSIELKGLALGLATAIAVLGLTFATAAILQPRQPPKPSREPRTASVFVPAIATRGTAVAAAELDRVSDSGLASHVERTNGLVTRMASVVRTVHLPQTEEMK